VCSSDLPLATASAIKILQEGGNALDAALSAVAVQCVVEPHMTGIGGDCFAIIGEPDGTLHGINGSGRSPARAELEYYLENGFSHIPDDSPHSITVPGAVKAWETMHQRFGSMDFTRLFADAINYAENGYAVGSKVANDWAQKAPKIRKDKGASSLYLVNGAAPKVGDIMSNPALGTTLRRIALEGSNALYSGEIAEEIAETVQSKGGFLSEEDLANVSADWITPISTLYRGHELHELPPNGQGITALILLNILRKIDEKPALGSVARAHLEMECGRIAYAVRNGEVSDPDHMLVSVDRLLSDEYTALLADQYQPTKRNMSITRPSRLGSDTVYLTVVDRDLMSVSFINSLFAGFGSGIATPKSGITLQNRGSGFVVARDHPNAIGPSKRPMHTIIPAMVTRNGKITHSFGVMGGQYQSMGHVHVLSNMLDHGLDPQQALDDARMFWDEEGTILAEAGVSESVVQGLRSLGHTVNRGGPHGGGQIIEINHEKGVLCAGSDPRKDGHAAGY